VKDFRPFAALATTAAIAALSLAACTTPDPAPTASATATSQPSATASPSPSVAPSPSATPSPSPTPTVQGPASVTAPSGWKKGSKRALAEAAADPEVTAVVGVWTDPAGADISVVETANENGTLDPEAYFKAEFGSLGESDGVEVTHTVTTTDAGDPMLTVGISPAGGLGGDAQAMFFVLTPESIVSGVATTSADGFAAAMGDMASAGGSVTFG